MSVNRETKEKFLEEYLELCRRYGLMIREGEFAHGDSWWSPWGIGTFDEQVNLPGLKRALGTYLT